MCFVVEYDATSRYCVWIEVDRPNFLGAQSHTCAVPVCISGCSQTSSASATCSSSCSASADACTSSSLTPVAPTAASVSCPQQAQRSPEHALMRSNRSPRHKGSANNSAQNSPAPYCLEMLTNHSSNTAAEGIQWINNRMPFTIRKCYSCRFGMFCEA